MFDRIIAALEDDGINRANGTYEKQDIVAAVAALYFHMIAADGVVTMDEIAHFRQLLHEQFDLSQDELDQVVTQGAQEQRDSPGLFPFTAILNRELDGQEKANILLKLQELANADGTLDPLEAEMLAHVSRLLRLDD